MKKILTILFLLVGYISFAQSSTGNDTTRYVYYYGQYGLGQERFEARRVMNPPQDTSFSKTGIARKGNSFYVGNGSYWTSVSSNIFLSAGVDSVTLYNNILCQYKSGVTTCYSINPINCNYFTGKIVWDSALHFTSTVIDYYINCKHYTAPVTSLTLDPAYGGADRTDVFYVDTNGVVSWMKGGVSGLKPQVDPASQLEIASVDIGQGDTIPTGFANNYIYRENIEWIFVSDAPGATGDHLLFPYAGLKSTYVSSFTNTQYIQYTNTDTLDLNDINFLTFYIRLNTAFDASTFLSVKFQEGAAKRTNYISILNGTYGFNSSLINAWQPVIIPISDFAYSTPTFDGIYFNLSGASAGSFQLDNIRLQGGLTTTSGDVVNAFNNRKGYVMPIRADYSQWFASRVVLNSDSTYYYLQTIDGITLDSVQTFLTRFYPDSCFTIADTTGGFTLRLNPYCMGSGGGGISEIEVGYGLIKVNDSTVKADTTILVNKAGDQTITGVKIFQNHLTIEGDNSLIFAKPDGSLNGQIRVIGDSSFRFSNNYAQPFEFTNYNLGQNSVLSIPATYGSRRTLALSVNGNYADANGNVVDAGTAYTASNGLTLIGSDVALGGTLSGNTTIATGANTLTLSTATSAINPLKVTSTTGAAILVNTTTGIGFSAVTNGGTGLNIVNSSGLAIYGKGTNAAAIMQLEAANANSATLSNIQLYRTTTSTAANDIGQSLDFVMETSDGTNAISNQFLSKWSDATTATRTSKFILTGVNSAVTADLLTISGSGATQLNKYGIGTFTSGTPAYGAAWDASGNLMEVSLSGGGTVTNIATGLGLSGGPITTTGTLLIDTADASILSRQRAAATYLPINNPTATGIVTIPNGTTALPSLSFASGSTTGLRYTTSFGGGIGLSVGAVHAGFIGYAPAVTANGQGNTFVGYKSGELNYSTTTNAYNNAFFGGESGQSNTSGYQNVFIGSRSGFLNTTGFENSYLGQGAGYSNLVGGGNVAAGFHAFLNGTGSNNIAIGSSAFAATTAVSSTIAIGFEALKSNTTGTFNTALGHQALKANTTGEKNTALGYLALTANINTSSLGVENTAVGSRAGATNTTGYMNVFNGSDAGFTNSTGYFNTFIGRAAGKDNSVGFENVYIGKNANVTGTGSANIIIGKDVLTSATGSNNQLNIGGLLFGINTYNASTGKVGVGALPVTDRLEVTGNVSLMTAGNKLKITEGSDGSVGQTTLVSGTKAITITGVGTSTRAIVTFVSIGGTVTTTWQYKAVCTANTLTITAIDNTGATNTSDTSILNYFIIN